MTTIIAGSSFPIAWVIYFMNDKKKPKDEEKK